MFIQYQGLSSQAKRLIDNEITLSGRNIETGSGRSARPPCNTSILIISQNPTITSAKVQTYKIFWLPAKNVRTGCGLAEQIYHRIRILAGFDRAQSPKSETFQIVIDRI
jgi:hypothetical protein